MKSAKTSGRRRGSATFTDFFFFFFSLSIAGVKSKKNSKTYMGSTKEERERERERERGRQFCCEREREREDMREEGTFVVFFHMVKSFKGPNGISLGYCIAGFLLLFIYLFFQFCGVAK
jgi:hypothetical protein